MTDLRDDMEGLGIEDPDKPKLGVTQRTWVFSDRTINYMVLMQYKKEGDRLVPFDPTGIIRLFIQDTDVLGNKHWVEQNVDHHMMILRWIFRCMPGYDEEEF